MAGLASQTELKLSPPHARLAVLHLAVMMNAGVSITKSLEALTEAPQASIRAFGAAVYRYIINGYRLSQAMGMATKSYTKPQISLLATGEKTGRLPFVLSRLSDQLEREQHLRQQLKSALTYPLGIFIVAGLMALFMMNFMLPHLLSAAGPALQNPPLPTRILASIAENGGVITTLFLVGLATLPWFGSSVPQAQAVRNWFLFRSPVLGPIGRATEVSNLSGQLSLLLDAGLTLDRALAALSPKDPILGDALVKVLHSVSAGHTLANSFLATGEFDPTFVAMVEVGEETGRISTALKHQADYLEQNTQRALQEMVKLVEPITMLLLGGMVGFVILGCFLPIYQVVLQNL